MCAVFRPLQVTVEQANKCEYPVTGSVRFWPEQISAVTDSVPEQWWLDCTITNYTVNHKKRDILFLTITLASLN